MQYNELVKYAKSRGYEVFLLPLRYVKGVTVIDSGHYHIAISDEIAPFERAAVLAHEIGHCETKSFYSVHDSAEERNRKEKYADEWAAMALASFQSGIEKM